MKMRNSALRATMYFNKESIQAIERRSKGIRVSYNSCISRCKRGGEGRGGELDIPWSPDHH